MSEKDSEFSGLQKKNKTKKQLSWQIWVLLDKITVQLLIFIDTRIWVQLLRKISMKICRKLPEDKLAGDNLLNSSKAFSYFHTVKSRFEKQ